MEQFFAENGEAILRLVAAAGFGVLIGAERLFVHKEAGIKTHALVSMGSALFIIISETMALAYEGTGSFDPSRLASQIIVGIGFLGAGSIIFKGSRMHGLTTAGGLWVMAGIGMACGFGLISLAAVSTVLVLFIFIVMNIVGKPIRKISEDIELPKV